METEVLYLDGDIAVVSKPAMLMVEPDKLGHPNLQDWGEYQWGGKTWAVHRLDRPTSGLLVIARKKYACTHLMKQFESRKVKKRYQFKTHKELPTGSWNWEDYLKKDNLKFKSLVVNDGEGQRASLRGVRIDDYSAEVELFTGRYHQIRAQASFRGYPILGDVFYGGDPWDQPGVALHASHLSFLHPKTNEEMSFDSLSTRF
ncbi:MAG: Ribosomal large subunit pseudouridine synthase A [Owenweeksia sp. TMED14]|nr:MAG: Ribosomal large subunit pseudouridine synthase A [Owenweeksia sp. TMED14]